ncbi:MAG: LuxR C-terminal-related transcriptional regulator [Hyphomicrobium sp.]
MIDESRALSKLIAEIYDAALARDAWGGVLAKVCTFVGASAGNFFSQQSSSRNAVLHFSWGNDPEYERLYMEKYYKLNPLVPALSFVDVGVVFSQSDLIPYDEFHETRFFKEWVEPQGLLDVVGANLDKSAAGSSMLAMRRSTSDGFVDAECRRRLELVVPHMRRAVLIGNVIETHKNTTAALSGTLMALSDGVFLVDSRSRIVFCNAAGDALLRRSVIVRGLQSQLTAVDARANRLLQDAVAASDAGDIAAKGVAVALSPTPEQWLAHVMPLSPSTREQAGIPDAATAAVFVRKAAVESPSALEIVAKLYKLTAMEVRVLQAVVEIGGAPVAAEALGISEATVKTHLRNLYQKTDCRRQADLVKLVAGSVSPFLS